MATGEASAPLRKRLARLIVWICPTIEVGRSVETTVVGFSAIMPRPPAIKAIARDLKVRRLVVRTAIGAPVRTSNYRRNVQQAHKTGRSRSG